MANRTARKRKWRLPRKKAARKVRSQKPKAAVRAIWKGIITFGAISVPVKLYSAVTDKSIHFRLLDPRKHQPVKQQMLDPKSDDVVEHAESRKAWQSKAGLLVILDKEELEKAEPRPSRDVEIQRFVAPDQVSSAWYERPYWLGPDTGATKAYFALARGLAGQDKVGIARWVMRGKNYVGALKAQGDYLTLITLRHKGEVVSASDLPAPAGRDLSKSEIDMARQLVESMAGEWKPEEFKDEYRERVLELVEAKAAGRVLKFPKARARREPTDLMGALEKSLAAAKRRESA